jgi:hypothetical protein
MKNYKIGDVVPVFITGCVSRYQAEILRLTEEGYPDRLRVVGDASWERFTLKPGDFILLEREDEC